MKWKTEKGELRKSIGGADPNDGRGEHYHDRSAMPLIVSIQYDVRSLGRETTLHKASIESSDTVWPRPASTSKSLCEVQEAKHSKGEKAVK